MTAIEGCRVDMGQSNMERGESDSLRERVEKAFHEPQYQKVKRDLEYFIYSNAWYLVQHATNIQNARNKDFHFDSNNVDYDGMADLIHELFDEQDLASLNTKTEDILQASLYKDFKFYVLTVISVSI